MATAATVTIRLDGDSATLIRELNKANRSSKGTFSDIQKHGAALAKSFAVIGAAAAAAFAVVTRQSFQAIDALGKASDQLGITTQSLAGMKLAASQAGVEFGSLTTAIAQMQRRLVDIKDKGGEAAITLDKLRLNAADLLRLSPEEQFRTLADAIAGVENPSERTAIAMTLFGRAGAQLLPLLRQGASSLDEYQAKAEALGLAVSRVDAAKVEAANDALELAGEAVKGVANQFAIAFAPSITEAANRFTDFVASNQAFAGSMRLIASIVTDTLRTVGEFRIALDLLKTAGSAAFVVLVNGANLLQQSIMGLQMAALQVEIFFRELKGEKPFDDPASKARVLQAELERLNKQFADLERHNTGRSNAAGMERLRGVIQKTQQELKALGVAGDLAPLLLQLDRLNQAQVDLGAELEKGVGRPAREVRDDIRALDGQVAALKQTIRDAGGAELLVNVGTDRPLSRLGELQKALTDLTERRREMELFITPGELVARVEALGAEAGQKAGDAAGDEFAKGLQAGTGAPLRIAPPDISDIIRRFEQVAVRQEELQVETAAEIRRIAITGEAAVTDELVRITEERARLLTAIERKAAEDQAAASGQALQFEQEKQLAKNRAKVAQELAETILAARRTVVTAGWAIDLDAVDQATPQVRSLKAELDQLRAQRLEVAATADTSQAMAQLALLDAKIVDVGQALHTALQGQVFELDFGNIVGTLEEVNRRRIDLTRDANEEIRRIAVEGERQISQDLQTTIAAMAQNLTEIQQRQAELQAAASGQALSFDFDEALARNQVQVANEVADGLIAARERVKVGGPMALPTADPAIIAENTRAQADAALQAFLLGQQQRREAQQAQAELLYMNEEAAGRALIDLAMRQAREKVLAEWQARGEALDETGQIADPEARAAFEQQVQAETLAREQEFLNDRLRLQEQFGSRYLALQKLMTALTGKQWADSHQRQLANISAFAQGALAIGSALFADNKALGIANAVINTYQGVTRALADVPFPANIAAAATVLATGLAQVQSIRSTNVGGGGGFGGGISGGAFSAPQLPDAQISDRTKGGSEAAIQVIFQGDVHGWDDYIQSKVVEGLREAVDSRDVILFSSGSRQARELGSG